MFKLETDSTLNIKVIGIGGAGNNIVNLAVDSARLSKTEEHSFAGVEFININTDSQVLKNSPVPLKIQLGTYTTRGEGTGGDIIEARRAVEEQREEIIQVVKGAHLVFLVAGLGGGTGTGATPVISDIASQLGAMTIGVVTLPFSFEGRRRRVKAFTGKEKLKNKLDTLIAIENDRLFASFTDGSLALKESFDKANALLAEIVESLSSLLLTTGIVNLDMAAFRKVMVGSKDVVLSIGEGNGEDRVSSCVQSVLNSPWLEKCNFKSLKRVLVDIMGGEDLTFKEASRVVEMLNRRVHPEAYITFGAVTLPRYNNKLKVVVVGDTTPIEATEELKSPLP
ncbi:MAG TPA: cell division protein FtsZ, partial [Candidatus Omnitrophica bacterium]|nr:cell division protein FtsZ [Candidatus Omnitrophota bacterium]